MEGVGPQSITKHSRSFSRKLLSPFSDQIRKVVEIAAGYVTFAIHYLLHMKCPFLPFSRPFMKWEKSEQCNITKHRSSVCRFKIQPY